MIAAIQGTLVVLALTALAALSTWCAWRGCAVGWMATLAAAALGPPMLLGIEFALMWVVNQHGDAPKPRLSQVLRAWFDEAVLAIKVFAWRQPFRSNAIGDFVPRCRAGTRGVVLVHGYACNRGIWNAWLLKLRNQAVPTIAVNLEPPWAAISSYERQIERAVVEMESATGTSPVLVGHSMGGLAVRHWYGRQTNPARLHHLITLGTPHRGTWLARFALGSNGAQMRPGSPFLTALVEAETEAHLHKTTCFYSHCDNIVFPAINATLAGAHNRHIEGCAHVQLIEHPQCWGALQELLDPVPPRSAHPIATGVERL